MGTLAKPNTLTGMKSGFATGLLKAEDEKIHFPVKPVFGFVVLCFIKVRAKIHRGGLIE